MAKKTGSSAPADNTKGMLINEAEFIRTRDAVVTAWTRLHGALQQAIQAYIDHTNAVLEDEHVLDGSSLQVLINAAAQPPPLIVRASDDAIKDEDEDGDKKRKRKKTPRDPDAPKRPLTAFLLFMEDARAKLREELGTDKPGSEISAEGTRRWKAMSDAERQTYRDRYNEAYSQYVPELNKYRAERGLPPATDPHGDATAQLQREMKKSSKVITEMPPNAAVGSDADSSSISSDTDSTDSDDSDSSGKVPGKTAAAEPPAKRKPGRPVGSKTKPKPAPSPAVQSSAAALTSSPPHTNKKAKATFTSVNAEKGTAAGPPASSPSKKRKSAADDAATTTKKAKKATADAGPGLENGAKKDKKEKKEKKRKSVPAEEA